MIKAFLLDLDGVITESSNAHFEAWKLTSKRYDIDLPDHFEESLKGISRKESLEAILTYANVQLDEPLKQTFMHEKNHLYQQLISTYNESHLFEGVLDLFKLAKAHHIKLALVSASKNADILLDALGIKNHFDYIVDPALHPSKPAPDMFIDALNYFDIHPEEALGFEDAKAGIKAIQNAKIIPIGIGNFEGIDAFKSIKEALPTIKTLIKRRHELKSK